jgi:hypothetical protein
MISEKIQNLIKELHDECEKEEAYALCIVHQGPHAVAVCNGKLPDIAMNLAIQEMKLDEELPVPTRILRNAGLDAMGDKADEVIPDHTFVVNDLNDMHSILDRIVKGEF